MATISVLRKPKSESQISDDVQSEVARFSSILKRLERSTNPERVSLRQVLVEYILFSPNSTELISTLILSCLSMKSPDRLDIAIDILSQVKHVIADYAFQYLQQDIKQWNKLYPQRKFQPNSDYWYVLLRSVGKAKSDPKTALQIIIACQDEPSHEVAEAVCEALGDLRSADAISLLRSLSESPNSFVQAIAKDVLAGLNIDE